LPTGKIVKIRTIAGASFDFGKEEEEEGEEEKVAQ
jgi:hypothetical protein